MEFVRDLQFGAIPTLYFKQMRDNPTAYETRILLTCKFCKSLLFLVPGPTDSEQTTYSLVSFCGNGIFEITVIENPKTLSVRSVKRMQLLNISE